ncbi:MAG: hypothetical protein EOO77_35170 [Oxalobacteraceae bacterium]|nr:MAG: hypothetical protein EOO77_35170 [Oxalobacteraceae bacterium]
MTGISYNHVVNANEHKFQPRHHRLAFGTGFTETTDPAIESGAEYTPDFIAAWLTENIGPYGKDWRIGHSGTIYMRALPQALEFKLRFC